MDIRSMTFTIYGKNLRKNLELTIAIYKVIKRLKIDR